MLLDTKSYMPATRPIPDIPNPSSHPGSHPGILALPPLLIHYYPHPQLSSIQLRPAPHDLFSLSGVTYHVLTSN
jgi:hypothetical protein